MATDNVTGFAREFEFQLLLLRAERICRAIAQHFESHHQEVALHWENAWGPIATVCLDLQRWSDENKNKAAIDVDVRLESVELITQSVVDLCASVAATTLTDAAFDLMLQLHDLAIGMGKFHDTMRPKTAALMSDEGASSAEVSAPGWLYKLQRSLGAEMPGLPKALRQLMS